MCSSLRSLFTQAGHVIHLSFNSTLNANISRLKNAEKKNKVAQQQESTEFQLLFTQNENRVYRTNNGYIINDNRKVKIVHTELLYTIPEKNVCTHMILYLDQDLIDLPNIETEEVPLMMEV